jgi:hypothetical protein
MKRYRTAWLDSKGEYHFEEFETEEAAILLFHQVNKSLDPLESAIYLADLDSKKFYKLRAHVKGE